MALPDLLIECGGIAGRPGFEQIGDFVVHLIYRAQRSWPPCALHILRKEYDTDGRFQLVVPPIPAGRELVVTLSSSRKNL